MTRNNLYHNIPNFENVSCLVENRSHNIFTPSVFVLLSSASMSVVHRERKKIEKYSKPKLEQTQLSPEGMETSTVTHPLVAGTLHSLFHVIPVRQELLPAP